MFTQTLNRMIWEGLAKILHCGLQKLEFGVYDASASFIHRKNASMGYFCFLKLWLVVYIKIVCEKLYRKWKSLSLYKINYVAKMLKIYWKRGYFWKRWILNRCKNIVYQFIMFLLFFTCFPKGLGYIFGSFNQDPTKLCWMANISYIYDVKLW